MHLLDVACDIDQYSLKSQRQLFFVLFCVLFRFSIHPGEESHFDLWASASASPSSKEALSEPRFGLYIVDCPGARYKSGPFAVFIVPQGR